MSEREFFPVMGGPRIPFAKVQAYNDQCIRNHGQSAERLAQRGGMCWEELAAVVQGRGCQTIAKGPSEAECEAIVREALGLK